MNLSEFGLYSHGIQMLLLIITLLGALLHVLMATGVAKDLSHLQKQGAFPLFMPAFAWVLTVLVFGLWALAIYWLLHHSNIAK